MTATFSLRGMLRGARAIAPVSMFVIPFGIAFGIAASQAGLSHLTSMLMSAFVFAGASQFAALPLWGDYIPILPLLFITFAVNARHILMSASLYPWMRTLPWTTKLGSLTLLSDANFALAMKAHEKGEWDVGHMFGGGLVLWTTWLIGTAIGITSGEFLGDPRALGLDVVMITFFTALLAGSWKGMETLIPWTVAGIVALIAFYTIDGSWYIIIGALAGGIAGVLRHDGA